MNDNKETSVKEKRSVLGIPVSETIVDHTECAHRNGPFFAQSYDFRGTLRREEHLDELKALYGRIPTHKDLFHGGTIIMAQSNPDYPKESYEQYLAKLIEEKKRIIGSLIRLSPA
jgi:hypothetical protein